MRNNFKNLIGFKFQVLCFILLLFPVAANAQSLHLSVPKTSYRVGDSFFVSLNINTSGNSVNTISGKITVPIDKFSISEVRSGNSILTLWVEQPKINYATGEISFSGGLPGGFNGSSGPILSIGLKAKSIGSAPIKLGDFTVLLNDGLGTQLQGLTLGSLNLNVSSALVPKPSPKVEKKEIKKEEVLELPLDLFPPEEFIPIISRHPSVGENKYFVSFNAVDKDSGIARYEIREELWLFSKISKKFVKDWEEGTTPFVLDFQFWRNKVIVRAYDFAGNFTDGFAVKPFHPIALWVFVALAILVAVFLTWRMKTGSAKIFSKRLKLKIKK